MGYCENAVEIVEKGGRDMGKRTEIILEGLQEPTWILNPDPTDPKNQEILHLQDKVTRLQQELDRVHQITLRVMKERDEAVERLESWVEEGRDE